MPRNDSDGRVARGRPRDPALDRAILEAALERLATDGYARMTLGDVARDANVTRPTIYARWSNLHDLVVDALRLRASEWAPPDLASLEPLGAVKAAMRGLIPERVRERGLGLFGHVLADARRHPELMEIVQQQLLKPRREVLLDALRRVRDEGLLGADVDLEVVADLLAGSYVSLYLRTGDLDPSWPDRVVDTLWPSLMGGP